MLQLFVEVYLVCLLTQLRIGFLHHLSFEKPKFTDFTTPAITGTLDPVSAR